MLSRVQGRSPEKGGVADVQYTTMVALIKEAELAGEGETEFVNDSLFEAFDIWLSGQHFEEELTRQEKDVLYEAFQKGYGICFHDQA
jgi:hypothetical protein